MKKYFALAGILLLSIGCLRAQDSIHFIHDSIRIYYSKVRLYDEPHKLHGAIYQLRDSSILFSKSLMHGPAYTSLSDISELYIDDIVSVHSDKGKTFLGALIGAAAGFGIGFLYGYESAQTAPSDGWDIISLPPALVGTSVGLVFSLVGGTVGGVVGSHLSKTPIYGSMDNYRTYKDRLREVSIR